MMWLQRHDKHRCLRGPVGGSRGWGVQMTAAVGTWFPVWPGVSLLTNQGDSGLKLCSQEALVRVMLG